jgi:peptidoglycan L-alanyl-D-glutamate endopeptidase CwlK
MEEKMSVRLFSDDIQFYQRVLSVAGFYGGPLNGKWTPLVDVADQAFSAEFARISTQLGTFDPRTENALRTLLPVTQRAARLFLSRAKANFAAYTVRVLSGTRTYAEQDLLYKKGRFGNSPPKVTNAKGGQSNHNFGIAWDIGIFDGGKYLTGNNTRETNIYKQLASTVLSDDLEWGGNWVSIVDMPHYQLKLDLGLSEVRNHFEAGKPYT